MWCIVCAPKPDLTMGTSRQRNRTKPPRNLVLGLKKWIGQVRSENKTQLRKHKVVHCMHPKTRSHNRYLPVTESRETTQNIVLGLKKWIGHVRCEKTRRKFGSTKGCILCTPKPDITSCTSRQRNRAKPLRNIVLGLKKWIWHVRCEKTRHNFGCIKRRIVCTPKPILTTGTSRQRNRAKPPRNLVLGLKKWIG